MPNNRQIDKQDLQGFYHIATQRGFSRDYQARVTELVINNQPLDPDDLVYINGSQVIRSKVFPAPSAEGSYGVFNASPMVRSFVTNYFEPSGNSILVASNDKIKVDYDVRIGEEVSGVTTTNLASGSYSAYNFVPPLFADVFLTKKISNTSHFRNGLRNGSL